ncbi:MAG: hypothetical protein P8R31_02365, partial [Mariniblastus sp.]|nr:hypothetical protein [Mariniblastus sp.]
HSFPDHLRQIQDSAENLGVRVKLPVLPMEAEFLNGRNQELMDRWKNIVTEFIESIKETNSKLMRIEKEANSTKTNGQKPTRPATVNQRMAGKITENYEALGWNSTQWAKHLKCAKSTVVATATWKQLKVAQQKAKAEGMKDRRRKPKASDSRRD